MNSHQVRLDYSLGMSCAGTWSRQLMSERDPRFDQVRNEWAKTVRRDGVNSVRLTSAMLEKLDRRNTLRNAA